MINKIKLRAMLVGSLLLGLILGIAAGQLIGQDDENELINQPLSTLPSLDKNKSNLQKQARLDNATKKTVSDPANVKLKTQIQIQMNNQELDQLNQQINQLQKILADKDQELSDLTTANKKLVATIASLEVKKMDEEVVQLDQEQLEKLLPPPFTKMMLGATGIKANYFNRFTKEAEDYEWSQSLESNISQFVQLHEKSYDVSINSVQCKTTVCEIRGFETGSNAWSSIMNDMMKQDWWHFSGATTNFNNSSDKEHYFYALLAKNSDG